MKEPFAQQGYTPVSHLLKKNGNWYFPWEPLVLMPLDHPLSKYNQIGTACSGSEGEGNLQVHHQ